MHVEINKQHTKNNNYITKTFEGTTLSNNLRKHADAPKIPSSKHPHKKYNKYDRIKLTFFDPELQQYEQQMSATDPEWFNKVTLDDIHCNCPHKDKFEQIFDKEETNVEAMVWTACKHTTLAAAKRQMRAAPVPNEKVAEDFVNHSMNIINKEVGDQLTDFKYSVVDWYNHLNTKKQNALKHVINYYRGNITEIPRKELSNINKHHYTGILKEEIQPTDGKPRMVCSIPQRTKYIMGPITWQLEEIMQDHLQGYCGGKNLDQMAEHINEYLKQGFTKIVEGDGSAFDNTQDVSLKELDRRIYKKLIDKIYHVPKEDFIKTSQALYKTMDIEYIENNKKKLLMRYKILGTVFSGDCDTTLMNTIRMTMYNRYVNDKAGLQFGKDYVCFSKGDDFTVMYKPYITDEFINHAYYKYFLDTVPDPSDPEACIKGIGQVLKFLEIGDASIIKFCSLNAWWTDTSETQIYLTRDVHKFLNLSKYSRKYKSYTMPMKINYLRDMAYSLKQNYTNIRFFTLMATYYDKLADRIQQDTGITNSQINKIKFKLQKQYQKPTETLTPQYIFLADLEEHNQDLIAHRLNQVKIQDDYWQTMQLIEKAHQQQLDQHTAEYVSKEIDLEIREEIIKSMYDVGLKLKY